MTPAEAPPRCGECGFDWRAGRSGVRSSIVGAPDRFRALLGDVGADDLDRRAGGWSCRQYLWHVVDVVSIASEHPVRGRLTALDLALGNAHEVDHHLFDVVRILGRPVP